MPVLERAKQWASAVPESFPRTRRWRFWRVCFYLVSRNHKPLNYNASSWELLVSDNPQKIAIRIESYYLPVYLLYGVRIHQRNGYFTFVRFWWTKACTTSWLKLQMVLQKYLLELLRLWWVPTERTEVLFLGVAHDIRHRAFQVLFETFRNTNNHVVQVCTTVLWIVLFSFESLGVGVASLPSALISMFC